MFDWRTWLKAKLEDITAVTAIAVGGIHGQLDETPADKPFIVFRFNPTQPTAVVGLWQDVTIWFHDVGGYTRIDELMVLVREALVGQVSEVDAVCVEWNGDSGDLADDARGTLVRNSVYRFAGRR
jgi:hypothetical protein